MRKCICAHILSRPAGLVPLIHLRLRQLSGHVTMHNMTTFLIVLALFCVGLFPSLLFPAYRNPFSICCTAGLVHMYSLNFACLESF